MSILKGNKFFKVLNKEYAVNMILISDIKQIFNSTVVYKDCNNFETKLDDYTYMPSCKVAQL